MNLVSGKVLNCVPSNFEIGICLSDFPCEIQILPIDLVFSH